MLLANAQVDLHLTLVDSAQCFGWIERGGWFGQVLDGKPVWLARTEDGILCEGCDAAYLRDYLDLNRDYRALASEYDHLPAAKRAIEMYPGLRVLNQPVWDTLVMFILSANNNVSRIRRLCMQLSEHFGVQYDTPRGTLYSLPSPERLVQCDEASLRALGVGYRASYLIGSARAVIDGFPIYDLAGMDYDSAHARLLALPGVGDKVADCILLFGCRQTSAFPVDVWVEKLLRSWFRLQSANRNALRKDARRMFGDHAGLLQQFLYHAARTGGMTFE